jgi:hypothetical protein
MPAFAHGRELMTLSVSSSAKADDPVITAGSEEHRYGLNRTFPGYWMPAFAGMTPERLCFRIKLAPVRLRGHDTGEIVLWY